MAQAEDGFVEHTLAVFREVSAFKIPPRAGSGGIKSGEWRIDDQIWSGRLVVADCGKTCELRLSDADTGELFAVCPVRPGERNTSVEPAADSSRNFVIRVVDPATQRHAFLGMSFTERGDAFDFNVALSDWEKHLQPLSRAAGGAAASAVQPQQPQQDYSLKAGETIKVKPISAVGGGGGGGFLAGLSSVSASGQGAVSGSVVGTVTTPPAAVGGLGLLPPPPPAASGGFAPSGISRGLLPPGSGSSSQAPTKGTGSSQVPVAKDGEWNAFS